MLRLRSFVLSLSILLAARGALAQTAVTNNNDGIPGSVPVYVGNAAVGNSPLSISGNNVGVGTAVPQYPFEVDSTRGFSVAVVNPSAEAAGNVNWLDFYNYTFNGYPGVRIASADDGNFGSHLFLGTKPPGNTYNNVLTRLTILDVGNVGV